LITFHQGRIKASTPDEAATKIRKKYGDGKLTIRQPANGWFTYYLIKKEK